MAADRGEAIRQVFLFTFIHGSAWPAAFFAEKSWTCRSYSRMRYEPGVQTGITRSTWASAPRPGFTRISTSSRCVYGRGMETVNSTAAAAPPSVLCAPERREMEHRATNVTADERRRCKVLLREGPRRDRHGRLSAWPQTVCYRTAPCNTCGTEFAAICTCKGDPMPTASRRIFHICVALLAVTTAATRAPAQATLPAAMQATIDSAAREVLARTGAPSASIAVVRDGKIAYMNAYGSARLEPAMPATSSMRYSIGSVSKQFTATAILLLAERHKLSLDDKVGRFLPELTRANEVTVRQILSMTSGYQDYWPQDYVMPPMLKPTTARTIVNEWARKPLDFEPGTKWQYSNTNYVIAGLIVEKVSGMPLVDFLRKEIFTPLHMASVLITDDAALGPTEPERYLRYALGPVRVAPKEGKGWLFAAGELAMTASDLARWTSRS